jgi:hypothetical protein
MTSSPVCIPATAYRSEELHEGFTLIRRKLETSRPNIIFIQEFHHVTAWGIKKLRGLSPRVNYTNRMTAACQRS